MDETRFDALSRGVSAAHSRRTVARLLAASVATGGTCLPTATHGTLCCGPVTCDPDTDMHECCPPGDNWQCCPKGSQAFCATVGDTCCPQGSNQNSCPPETPVCCPSGSTQNCCLDGQTCDLTGCV